MVVSIFVFSYSGFAFRAVIAYNFNNNYGSVLRAL